MRVSFSVKPREVLELRCSTQKDSINHLKSLHYQPYKLYHPCFFTYKHWLLVDCVDQIFRYIRI
jgi:hypothetical protein